MDDPHTQILFWSYSEATIGGTLIKKPFLKISQYSQENTFQEKVKKYFMWILQNFREELFFRTTPVTASAYYHF